MRTVHAATQPPSGAVRLVGVLDGEPLSAVDVDRDRLAAFGFTGAPGETLTTISRDDEPLVLAGLGDSVDVETLRSAAGSAARAVPTSTDIATDLHRVDLDGALEAVVTGVLLGSYRFDEFKSADTDEEGDLTLIGDVDVASVERLRTLVRGITRSRDWGNQPASVQAPQSLAAEMADVLDAAGFEVEVWDERRIASERLGCLIGVAAGSGRPPAMLVAHRRRGGPHLALVGKGIVFDSGGLSIKSAANMEAMKGDMAGGASVVAAAATIGSLDIAADVSVYVPLTDNMPGGSAVKPGDVLTARNGKTIEVLNTDAEGRLVLADALSLAVEESPDVVVDLATLTGAARVALGNHIAAFWASDDAVADDLSGAATRSGERLWRMPLPLDYRSLIDSTVADMKNTGGRPGGAITAALLLAEFVGDVPWAHLDIAGPALFREDGPLGPAGASGFGVSTLVSLAAGMADAQGVRPSTST